MTETCHVAHMVVYSNVVVSMASLVLLMQLRHLLHALLARLRRHRLYSALATHMSRKYVTTLCYQTFFEKINSSEY